LEFTSPIEVSDESPVRSSPPSVAVGTVPQPTQLPTADAAIPAVATVTRSVAVSPTPKTNGDWTWMFWLAGSGMTLILGLLLFGRRLRDRFSSTPTSAAEEPVIDDDDETARNEALNEFDFPLGESQQEDQDYTLDADLGAGTGLKQGADEDVQEFDFSATEISTADLDMELPPENAVEPEKNSTDIIPLQRVEAVSILDEEILPEDDDYDLSMIVDATKHSLGDDVLTEKDLKAIPFDGVSAVELDVECTLNDSFGLDTLEKDYEYELTATQAANKEIEKAAAELALRMAEVADDKTAEMPATDSNEESSVVDATAEMPATDITAEVTSEVTVQMPGAADAENEEFANSEDTGFHNELTAQLPLNEGDATAEMVVESGHVNTKKSTG
jgi:hypothetical protein